MHLGDGRDLQDVLNVVYQAASRECESREHNGAVNIGNGHHMAQAIVVLAEKALLEQGLFVKEHVADQHEQRAQAFLTEVRSILIDALKLSPEAAPNIFTRANELTRSLQRLFSESSEEAQAALKKRFRERFDKFIGEL